jgi:hypothetical protein
MKKLFHLLIAGVLVLSITGCGQAATPETSRTRNGLLSEGAGKLLVEMPVAAVVHHFIEELLGGDGSAEVLEAIAALEEHLVKIDERLDEISAQVTSVQAGVDETISLVNLLIKQDKCALFSTKYDQLNQIKTVINRVSQDLYGKGASAGAVQSMTRRIIGEARKKIARQPYNLSFTTAETRILDTAKKELVDNGINFAVENMGAILLSSSSSPGLIALQHACIDERFMSSSDSVRDAKFISGFQILVEKAAKLQMWSLVYGEEYYSTFDLNKAMLEFANLYDKLEVMKAMPIPEGQVLDTETNKMWARGVDNIRLVDAMNGCPDATGDDSVDNKYQTMNESGKVITENLNCLSSTSIDMPMTDKTKWRLPAIYEMSQSPTQSVQWQGKGDFPSAGGWLFQDWKSGCGVKRASTCDNVARFLTDNGASELVSTTELKKVKGTARVDERSEDGLIWSSTSMAAASGTLPYPRATASEIVRENDKSLVTPRTVDLVSWSDGNCVGNDRALCKTHRYALRTGDSDWGEQYNLNACNALYGAGELRIAGGTYRDNCSDWRNSDLCHGGMAPTGSQNPSGISSDVPRPGPNSVFKYNDTPIPHTLASVRTANLSASRQEDEQVHAIAMYNEWGGSIDCTDVKSTRQWNSLFCCYYTQLISSLSFPEYARTLYVRDLMPNEFYTFSDHSGFGPKSWEKLEEVAPARINVLGLGGEFNVEQIGTQDARCTLDPATAPTTFDTFSSSDESCDVGPPISLKPGNHVVYAMGKVSAPCSLPATCRPPRFTDLVKEIIYFEGTPPPKAEFTVTPGQSSIVANLVGADSLYEYEATAFDGTRKITCKFTTITCSINELENNVPYEVTIKTSWGTQSSVSEKQKTTPFGPPPAFNCTVLAEDGKVTLNCSSPSDPDVVDQTPVAKYVVKNGTNVPFECQPATDCVINGLQNVKDTKLDVVATNNFGDTLQSITVRSIGKPAPPTGVVVSGSNGKITVSWTRESTGDAASKYVATATNDSATYSCISARTMTSPAPTECVITVPLPTTNSDLSYTVAVKGGNGNCSDSSTTCNYSASDSATTTVTPQFNPDKPVLVAEVKDSKIIVTATPGSNHGSTSKITITSDPIGLFCDASVSNQWKCVFANKDFKKDQIYTFIGTGYNANTVAGAPGTSNAVTVYNTPTAPVISQSPTTFDQKIYVTIDPSTEVIDSYTVTAAAGTGNFTCLISRPNQSCEVTGLKNGTAYTVSATAQNNGGVSASSLPKTGLKPFGVPSQPHEPDVTLDTSGGSAVFHLSMPSGVDGIETYEVEMLGANKTCTIVVPDLDCDILIDERSRGFWWQFTSTATNRIGESRPSERSERIRFEKAPLAPQDVILTTNNRDINVKIVPDADSSKATKFEVTASPGNYDLICPADGICALANAAGGKVYTITMKAINASGTSPAKTRLYYLTEPPVAPEKLAASASLDGIVFDLGAGKTPTDTDFVLVTATPSLGPPLSCKIIRPAKTCAIKSDTTKTYNISAVGKAIIGNRTSASKSFTPTRVVKRIAVVTQKIVEAAPMLKIPPARNAGYPVNKTISLGKKATSKIKIDTVYSAYIKSLPLSAGKVSLLKFSGKVKSDSKKICKIKGPDVILLKKGVCVISAKFKGIENKKSITAELPAKITVR